MKKILFAFLLFTLVGCNSAYHQPVKQVTVNMPRKELSDRLFHLEASCWNYGRSFMTTGFNVYLLTNERQTSIYTRYNMNVFGAVGDFLRLDLTDSGNGKGTVVSVYRQKLDWADAERHMGDVDAWLNGKLTCGRT